MILNAKSVQIYLNNAGFKGIDLYKAIEIIKCESNFNTLAHNTNNEDSRGLFQINVDVWNEFKNLDLFDPQINCNCAYKIYKIAGNSFKDWTCNKILNLDSLDTYSYIAIVFLFLAFYVSTSK